MAVLPSRFSYLVLAFSKKQRSPCFLCVKNKKTKGGGGHRRKGTRKIENAGISTSITRIHMHMHANHQGNWASCRLLSPRVRKESSSSSRYFACSFLCDRENNFLSVFPCTAPFPPFRDINVISSLACFLPFFLSFCLKGKPAICLSAFLSFFLSVCLPLHSPLPSLS